MSTLGKRGSIPSILPGGILYITNGEVPQYVTFILFYMVKMHSNDGFWQPGQDHLEKLVGNVPQCY